MEKLIELLNERKGSKHYYAVNGSIRIVGQFPMSELELISKKFGFIKWLVENDKIDNKKIADETYVKVNGELYEVILGCHYDLYQQTLMLLSISDTPIEDLISYLK